MVKDVYDFIKSEQASFKVETVTVADGWEWNMYEHIRKSLLYKNSKFADGPNDGERPFDNIILDKLLVAYRTEGFDVKDIVPYVNDPKNYFKSFLVKKYHPRWARKNSLDTFIDELVESYVDYGLVLVKEVNGVKPEVVKLEKIAFCDQSNVLAGPICIEHNYTPSELKDQTKWYQNEVDRLIKLMDYTPKDKKTKNNKIKVFELHGEFKESWLEEGGSDDKYVRQMQIVAFYEDKNSKKGGICLYKGKSKQLFKALKRDDIYGRACGRGGIEELFEPQIWTNYDAIQIKEMLDIAALILVQTADKAAAQRQKITDLSKGEVLYHDEGKPFTQVVLQPINKSQFDQNATKWENRARLLSSANEGLLGVTPSSGTPLGTTEITTSQNLGIHQYRQGKIAYFVGELYRDDILRYLVADMNKGQKFLEELSLDELQEVVDSVITKEANEQVKEAVLAGKMVTPDVVETFKALRKEEYLKKGTKWFVEIVKDELKDIPIDVEVNIVGKQADLAGINQRLTNIVRNFINDPRFQNEDMGKIMLELLESSGLSPLKYASFGKVFKNPTQSAGSPATPPAQTRELPAKQPVTV